MSDVPPMASGTLMPPKMIRIQDEYHRHADGDIVRGPAIRCIDPAAGAVDAFVFERSGDRTTDLSATRPNDEVTP